MSKVNFSGSPVKIVGELPKVGENAPDFRYHSFGNDYGVLMLDGPLQGLLARSIVAIDETGKVVYQELVPEITQEPVYEVKF